MCVGRLGSGGHFGGKTGEHVQRYRGIRAGCSWRAMEQFIVTGVWDPHGEAGAVPRVWISAVGGGCRIHQTGLESESRSLDSEDLVWCLKQFLPISCSALAL